MSNEEQIKLSKAIDDNFYNIVYSKSDQDCSQYWADIERDLKKLETISSFRLNAKIGDLTSRVRYVSYGDGKIFNPLLSIMIKIEDKKCQKETIRFVFNKGDFTSLDIILEFKLHKTLANLMISKLSVEEISEIKKIISCLGIHTIKKDWYRGAKIIKLCALDPEINKAFEAHLFTKARRYKSFINLTRYIEFYPQADKLKILREIFKYQKYYKAKAALAILEKNPDLQKYFIMK